MSVVLIIFLTIVGLVTASFLLIVFRGAPFIPSHKNQVRRAFAELYPLSDIDTVLDLGSGTGTVLSVAREHRARALGYELNPVLWTESCLSFQKDPGVEIKLVDYNGVSRLPEDVTVVYAFSTSRSIDAIGKKLAQWSKHQDLTFISYGFTLTGQKPDKTVGPMHLYHFPRKA